MSRFCAKPTCSGPAARWLNVNAAGQQVIEQAGPTDSTIALCISHAERFSMPNGWTWMSLDPIEKAPAEQVTAQQEAAPSADTQSEGGESQSTQRRHGRDAPWFLANSSDTANPSPAENGRTAATTGPAAVTAKDSDAPSTGSLLHRAFHGPDPGGTAKREHRTASTPTESATGGGDDDDVAPVSDITRRRSSRSSSSASYYDVELPFPPADSAPHVAVS